MDPFAAGAADYQIAGGAPTFGCGMATGRTADWVEDSAPGWRRLSREWAPPVQTGVVAVVIPRRPRVTARTRGRFVILSSTYEAVCNSEGRVNRSYPASERHPLF